MSEIKHLMGSFLYCHKGLENSPYVHLLDPIHWTEAADLFAQNACKLMGLPLESSLAVRYPSVCVCVCVCACMRACMRACVCTCVGVVSIHRGVSWVNECLLLSSSPVFLLAVWPSPSSSSWSSWWHKSRSQRYGAEMSSPVKWTWAGRGATTLSSPALSSDNRHQVTLLVLEHGWSPMPPPPRCKPSCEAAMWPHHLQRCNEEASVS